MQKIRFLLLVALVAVVASYGQSTSAQAPSYDHFKGVVFEKDYAVYGFGDGQFGAMMPEKLYIYELTNDGWWTIYDTVTITCHSFTLKLRVQKKYIIAGWDPVPDNNSGQPSAMAAPPNGSSTKVDQVQALKKANYIEKFEFKKKYTREQIFYNAPYILDEFDTKYGKQDMLSLSKGLFKDYSSMNKDLTLTDFLLQSKAHPFEKTMLLQNQMNLFLTEDEYRYVFKKNFDGSDLPPKWEAPVWCDTNRLKELAFYTPVFGGQCVGSWEDIYKCMQVNPQFEKAFNDYVRTIYPFWKNYRDNCITPKHIYEYNECKCQKVIRIEDGTMGYGHKSRASLSEYGLMPSDVKYDISTNKQIAGGMRWRGPNGIGHNPFNENIPSGDPNLTYTHDGSDIGVAGWYRYRAVVPHGSCSDVFTKSFSVGDTAQGTSLLNFEKSIYYACYGKEIDLISDCACPIVVQSTLKQRVDMNAFSGVQGNCWPLNGFRDRYHNGSIDEASIATFTKRNNLTNETFFAALDAGSAKAWSAASSKVNIDFVYKTINLLENVVTKIVSGGLLTVDTSLFGLIRSGVDLLGTPTSYDTIASHVGNYMLIDRDYSFELKPNDLATIRIDNFHTAYVNGRDGGSTELIVSKDFLAAFYSGASKSNICCKPAFISSTNWEMQLEQNNIYKHLFARGGNTDPWDYNSDCVKWGGFYMDFCSDTGTFIDYKSARAAVASTPAIKAVGKSQFVVENAPAGIYTIELFNIAGQKLQSFRETIDTPIHTLRLTNLDHGIYILNVANEKLELTKKISTDD